MGGSWQKGGACTAATRVSVSRNLQAPFDGISPWICLLRSSVQLKLNVHEVNDVSHTEIHTAEPLVPEPSAFEVEMAIEKHQVLIIYQQNWLKQGVEHSLIPYGKRRNCLRDGRGRSLYGEKTDCRNYRSISILSNIYKILSNILLSSLTPYIEEIIGDRQCGFWWKRSTADHIFCIHQIHEKNWEYNKAVHQHQLMIQFGGKSCIIFSMNLVSLWKIVRLKKMCLNET